MNDKRLSLFVFTFTEAAFGGHGGGGFIIAAENLQQAQAFKPEGEKVVEAGWADFDDGKFIGFAADGQEEGVVWANAVTT